MKKLLLFLSIAFVFSSCGWQRIGDLTMISNRNVDSSKKYVLIERNVQGKARIKKDDALERALDNATEKHKGEYLANAKIYVKDNGKWIKVEGDVWGDQATVVNVETSVTKKIEFNTGDRVAFKLGQKLIEGTIVGINAKGAIIELDDEAKTKKELDFDKLTKLDK